MVEAILDIEGWISGGGHLVSRDGWTTDLGLLTSDHWCAFVPQYPPQMLRFTDTFTRG